MKEIVKLDEVCPWTGEWAPSTSHNEAHWPLPLMKLSDGSRVLGNSTMPMRS